ncbi:hypothetical protein [Microbacterium maritypicum]|uniref:Uncharacterized protein n=1 Tax=Microbacterium maritypicum TaxID=33918 RepID=A0ACD4B8Z5_MICMQ|nr:hypothetical protein [Microbacterium liquefaciens]UTT53748.1 hypothetical protein NMQ05_03985 [Microbacterium liquefaciens]
MNTTKKTSNPAPRADYADKDVTPLMQEYADWLTAQTGYAVDPRSVFIGSALRSAFQKERREAKAAPKPARKRSPKAAQS